MVNNNSLIPANGLSASLTDAMGQISVRSRRIYQNDAEHLGKWMVECGVSPATMTRSDAIAYLMHLRDEYESATAKRMLSVARRLFAEQVNVQTRTSNPFEDLKGPKANNETPHTALEKKQVKDLLASVDKTTRLGKRDYAMLSLLIRTGIRRQECADINIGDISQNQGHKVVTIHGKGDKRRTAKIPVDVFRSIEEYIESSKIDIAPDAPLFVGFDRWDRPTDKRVSTKLIERTVVKYAAMADISDLTPHGLRATFATLSKEGGADLTQIQYAMGHDDPATTERYLKRKLNLDDNAVDYIKLG